MATPAPAPDFRPTHVVPPDGLPAWEAPDPARPTDPLDALLPVQLAERQGDWAYVVCSNGWAAWVDGRLLVSVPRTPPAPGQPLARTADPRPLLARAEEALNQYRRAAQDLAEGRSDGEGFRQRTRGLRVGMVVDGESVWLYDAEHERWVFCDGTQLSTYAAESGPGSGTAFTGPGAAEPGTPEPGATGPEPTRVVTADGPPEATRVVAPEGPEPPEAAAPDGPEPTRVVAPDAPEPTRVVTADEPEPTRVVTADGPEPTPVVTPEGPPEPTRVVTADGTEPTRIVTADEPEPTRIVTPDDSPDGGR
ncbi:MULTISPECIES: hypothetical protein [Streptomyces]|uniref:hypothetical protein n=1 Tax=Streptomyces TaxID=1883 RepID=UPI00103AF44A|nr:MULTISPECIES: hypothetical protein [Streptomyces]MBT3084820.1 hypothetical protein [Streptomyces sp. COG20]MBT3087717.1 hypothetical protein [Streptomyces sp. CYG21]MBT3095580.1 hypothetical protein [Streptomyces sp. CBG30]MBT3103232.1 hypothetical protein [Streptomyces sp. COG19]MDI7791332.1 hypothetical protein [Streptomyces cavourensis]